jgi:hypothetical protein
MNRMNRMIRYAVPLLSILGLLLYGGCAGGAPQMSEVPQEMAPSAPWEEEAYVEEDRSAGDAASGEATGIERKIVKTGYVTLEVEDVVEATDGVGAIAEELGGYVVSSYKRDGGGGLSGQVSIRVPSDRFDEAFDRLRLLATNVPYERIEARDITEEYVDLEARLRNLEATEVQYLALLEEASTVTEMLEVQEALWNVRWQIEQIQGRMTYLERTSDMSLIEVELEETKKLAESWSVSDAFRSAVRGLTSFGRALATLAVWLVVFCWIWIPILLIIIRRRRRRRAASVG